MAASRVKSVSFKDSEGDLLEYAEKQGNFSEYVKKLIDEDKKRAKVFIPTPGFEECVRSIIASYIKDSNIVLDNYQKSEIDSAVIDALDQF